MDRYPETNVSEQERARGDLTSSRHDSGSSVSKTHHSMDTNAHEQNSPVPRQHTSFPPPPDQSRQQSDSTVSSSGGQAHSAEAEYARYTDAPPPFSEEQYLGKSEEEQTSMRMSDYAKEISRMMGRQLVADIKTGPSDQSESESK